MNPRARLYLKQYILRKTIPPTDVKSLNRPLLNVLRRTLEPHLTGQVEDWLRAPSPSTHSFP